MKTTTDYPTEILRLIDLVAVEMLDVPRPIREEVLRHHLAQAFADCAEEEPEAGVGETDLSESAARLCRRILAAVRRIEHAGGGRPGTA
jgi:hypothetical protein